MRIGTGWRAVWLLGAFAVLGCAGVTTGPATTAGPTAASVPTASPTPTPPLSSTVPSPDPTLTRMIGQKLVVRVDGTSPSADLLDRVRGGEVGGVILFGRNVTDRGQLVALTGALRAAAADGGQPRLLIAVDQEGGAVRRIPWAPPMKSPPEIGRDGRARVARDQGAATGRALRALGIDVDLAPVADIPTTDDSFMAAAGRTFSGDPAVTARLATAFAEGLATEGVLPAMKHFPGIGSVRATTDRHVVTVSATASELEPALAPYEAAIAADIPMIMLSNATYPAYDRDAAAGWSAAIGQELLRDRLGFTGVTITDSLDGTAHARGVAVASLALRAATAGTDLLLLTGSEASSRRVHDALVEAAHAGRIPAQTLRASAARIEALKAGLGLGPGAP